MDLAGRYLIRFIARPSVIISFLICLFLYYILIPFGNNSSEFPLYEDVEMSDSTPKRAHVLEKGQKKQKLRSRKTTEAEKVIISTTTPPPTTDLNEFIHGSKRYKLFEKKQLNFKKAESYCKKLDGRLARTEKLDEMRRLQMLLQKAKLVSDDLWIGAEKKVWKKHAWKERDHPPGMNKEALGAMGAMMMGGGKQEMCPALGLSTRALAQVSCLRELPFVCEFDRVTPPPPTPQKVEPTPKPKKKVVKGKSGKSNKKEGSKKGKESREKVEKVTSKAKSRQQASSTTTVKPKNRQKLTTTTVKPRIKQKSTTTTVKPKIIPWKSKHTRKRDEI